jgi:hypothetical protein
MLLLHCAREAPQTYCELDGPEPLFSRQRLAAPPERQVMNLTHFGKAFALPTLPAGDQTNRK